MDTSTSHSTEVVELAEFVDRSRFEDLSPEALAQLKIRVLDTIGVAIAALDAEPISSLRGLLDDLGGTPSASLIGGGHTSPDRAPL